MILESMKDEIYKKKNPTVRSESLMSPLKSTTPITSRPHHSLQNTAQNKEYEKLQISSRILTWFSRVFLISGSYGFVTFLLHRETLISQSLKKLVTRSPCTLLVRI